MSVRKVHKNPVFLQEKSYVTGLEAANRVVDYLAEEVSQKLFLLKRMNPILKHFATLVEISMRSELRFHGLVISFSEQIKTLEDNYLASNLYAYT